MMKTVPLVPLVPLLTALIVSLAATAPAFAQNSAFVNTGDNVSVSQPGTAGGGAVGKTRAEVRAELVQAERAGLVQTGYDLDYPSRQVAAAARVAPAKTRAEVRGELITAEKSGFSPTANNLNYPQGMTPVRTVAPTVTRAQVRAELVVAESQHTLAHVTN